MLPSNWFCRPVPNFSANAPSLMYYSKDVRIFGHASIRVMQRRIGIFAGTFNPVHDGHLAFALAATNTCHLDEVVFLPELEPRRKSGVTSLKLRAKQLDEALKAYSFFRTVALNDRHFTVAHTLPQLQQLFPDENMTLLVGSDVALHLKNWADIKDLLLICNLAIGLRSQHEDSKVRQAMEELQTDVGSPVRYKLIKASHADVASSQFK